MKTILLALLAAVSFGIQTFALAEDEPAPPAATEESAPADSTNAMPGDQPAAEQGSSTEAMPAPTESESK